MMMISSKLKRGRRCADDAPPLALHRARARGERTEHARKGYFTRMRGQSREFNGGDSKIRISKFQLFTRDPIIVKNVITLHSEKPCG